MTYLIDTHTHFDVVEYNHQREIYNYRAYHHGIRHLLLIGILAKHFSQMVEVKNQADNNTSYPKHHLAFGLHPLYIQRQNTHDLLLLEDYIKYHQSIAIGEIGLDTFDINLKQEDIYQKQQHFFIEQIKLSKLYDLPILLHIRKSHADVLKILKDQKYNPIHQGGIAHSFSGGINEALAFAGMGFKIGITGQITNINAKKLHQSIKAVYKKYGLLAFVIETDCPDMMPISCQHQGRFNEPANLIYVFEALSLLFDCDKEILARTLWQNTQQALKVNWQYPTI